MAALLARRRRRDQHHEGFAAGRRHAREPDARRPVSRNRCRVGADRTESKLRRDIFVAEGRTFHHSRSRAKPHVDRGVPRVQRRLCQRSSWTCATAHEVGWWAHYAPGSGVWANVGTTLITGARGYRVACAATAQLTNRSSAACDQCCRPAHEVLFVAASELHFTSMQSCCGQRGGTGRSSHYEIVFFKGLCAQWRIHNTSACPRELNLRSGRTRAFLRRMMGLPGARPQTWRRLSRPAVHGTGMCKFMGMWR